MAMHEIVNQKKLGRHPFQSKYDEETQGGKCCVQPQGLLSRVWFFKKDIFVSNEYETNYGNKIDPLTLIFLGIPTFSFYVEHDFLF